MPKRPNKRPNRTAEVGRSPGFPHPYGLKFLLGLADFAFCFGCFARRRQNRREGGMTPNRRICLRPPILIKISTRIPGRTASPTWYTHSKVKLPKRPGPQKQSVESVGQGNVMMPFCCQVFSLPLSRNPRILYVRFDHTLTRDQVTNQANRQLLVPSAPARASRFVVEYLRPLRSALVSTMPIS